MKTSKSNVLISLSITLVILLSAQVAIKVTAMQLITPLRQQSNNQSQQGADQIQFLEVNSPIQGYDNIEVAPKVPPKLIVKAVNIKARLEGLKNESAVVLDDPSNPYPVVELEANATSTRNSKISTSTLAPPSTTKDPKNSGERSAYICKETMILLFSTICFVALTRNKRIIL